MLWIIVLVPVVLLTLPLSWWLGAALHEAGHAAFGTLAGFRVHSMGLGLADPLWVGRVGETRLFVARTRPLYGITFAVSPALFPSRGAWLLYLAGGILTQSAFGALCLAVGWVLPWGGLPLWICGVFNLFVAVSNLLPVTVVVGSFALRTDGALLLQTLQLGQPASTLRDVVHLLEGMRGLWRDVGDTLTPQLTQLGLAIRWIELGGLEQAQLAWQEVRRDELPPWAQRYASYVEATLAHAAGDPDTARRALDEAAAGPHHPALSRMVALERAALEDDPRVLNRLIDDPWVRERPAFRVALIYARLTREAALPGSDLAAIEAEHAEIPVRLRAEAQERALFHALARASVARSDLERARRSFQTAVQASERMGWGWREPASRAALQALHAPLLDEARPFLPEPGPAVRPIFVAFGPPDDGAARLHQRTRWIAASSLPVAGIAWALSLLWPTQTAEVLAALTTACALYGSAIFGASYVMRFVCQRVPVLDRLTARILQGLLLGGWTALLLAVFVALTSV